MTPALFKSVQNLAESLSAIVGSVGPRIVHWRSVAGHTTETECGGQSKAVAAAQGSRKGRLKKTKAKGKGKGRSGGKAKGKGKGLTCFVCGGIGHTARLCPSEGWVNDLEQDAPEGEDTNEDAFWAKEDGETLQPGFLGSESCLMSSPPGLRDAFSEAGWTVVTRKSRNRQQCSRRRG